MNLLWFCISCVPYTITYVQVITTVLRCYAAFWQAAVGHLSPQASPGRGPVHLPQVMHAIGIAGTRLSFDREKSELSHSAYLELAEACMSNDPADRPPFHTMHIVSVLRAAPARLPYKGLQAAVYAQRLTCCIQASAGSLMARVASQCRTLSPGAAELTAAVPRLQVLKALAEAR